jgi:hypothetical protein
MRYNYSAGQRIQIARNFNIKNRLETESQIRLLLETHKTKPCDQIDFHDARLRENYHPHLDDQRQYQTYYSHGDGTF